MWVKFSAFFSINPSVTCSLGLFCNRTFDRYACWPDTPAGTMVNISCPFYLPWYDKGKYDESNFDRTANRNVFLLYLIVFLMCGDVI